MPTTHVTVPELDVDPWSDEFIAAPYQFHDAIRNAGPVVRLSRYGVYAMARYDQVHSALADWETYISSAGVGIENLNHSQSWRPVKGSSLLEVDPPEHTKNRRMFRGVVSPKSVRALRPAFEERAEALVDELVARRTVDAIPEIAEAYPLSVLPDAVGISRDERELLLPFGSMIFNAFGPKNHIFETAMAEASAANVTDWAWRQLDPAALTTDGLGTQIYQTCEAAGVPQQLAGMLVGSFLAAGIDTTVNGIGSAILGFARFPDQWDLLRQDPDLIPVAFDEVLRWESPIQTFFRTTSREVAVGDSVIPDDSKVLLFLGAANRDPRQWKNPERLDISRRAIGHVAFGNGIHSCVGQMIARLEAELLLGALARRVKRIELLAEPTRKLNNTLLAMASLPVRLIPA
jgi:cytochrome P450